MSSRAGKPARRRPPNRLGLACRALGACALAAATGGAMWTPAAVQASPAELTGTDVGLVLGQPRDVAGPAMLQRNREVADDVAEEVAALRERTPRPSRDSARQAMAQAATGTLVKPRGGQAKEKNADIVKLAASAEKAASKIARNAWQLPLPRSLYRLTGRFGSCGSLWAHCHTGLDFAAPSGTPVKAIANGEVTKTGWAGAYGNRLILTLDDGTEIWYCHLSSYLASVGDRAVGGQPVGTVGSTGNSTGPHLHLEVRPGGGDAVDPYRSLSVKGQRP